MTGSIVVLGATGFVGSAVVQAVEARGAAAVRARAPRLPELGPDEAMSYGARGSAVRDRLAQLFDGARAVVNAAGIPDASSRNVGQLMSANAALPGVVAAAATDAGVQRLVHVSSAVVQGRAPVLDASLSYDSFSEYARSKVLGEQSLARYASGSVIYRPPSVHGPDRRVTRMTARIAASPLGSVARPPGGPSPQALIENVGDAVAFLATTPMAPPRVVIHPWEKLTTRDVMYLLGGRDPIVLPRPIALGIVAALRTAGRLAPPLAANARRVEMLWFGQRQEESWLTQAGWEPPAGREAWVALGESVRRGTTNMTTERKAEQ